MDIPDCDLLEETMGKSIEGIEIDDDGLNINLSGGKAIAITPSRSYRSLIVFIVNRKPETLQ